MTKTVIVNAKKYHSLRKGEKKFHLGGKKICKEGEQIKVKHLVMGKG